MKSRGLKEWAHLAVRCLVGGVFLWMGAVKVLAPADFLKQVHAYGILESPLPLNLTAAVIPWLEMVCGLLLVVGRRVFGAALVVLGMLAVFTVALILRALVLQGAGGLPFCAVRFDCGCGGGEVAICRKLIGNAALAGFAAWSLLKADRPPR